MANSVSFQEKTVSFGDVSVEFPYRVQDAFLAGSNAVVLLDADEYLTDPAYSQDRRRGLNPVKNLLAISASGDVLWEAEFPRPADYYYLITSHEPLRANSFSSYECEIDSNTGRILGKTFFK